MYAARVLSTFAGIIRGRGYYNRYEKMYSKDLRKIPSFELILKLTNGQVLDIGCGIGYLSNLFQDYVGLDINKKAISTAKKNTEREYVIGSIHNLPFRTKIFDTCVLYDLIEHLQNVEKAFGEMKRIGRSKVIISCVNFGSYYALFAYDETHVNYLTADGLSTLARKYFGKIRLFKTSGLFLAPEPVNIFLSKYFPNQLVLEAST